MSDEQARHIYAHITDEATPDFTSEYAGFSTHREAGDGGGYDKDKYKWNRANFSHMNKFAGDPSEGAPGCGI